MLHFHNFDFWRTNLNIIVEQYEMSHDCVESINSRSSNELCCTCCLKLSLSIYDIACAVLLNFICILTQGYIESILTQNLSIAVTVLNVDVKITGDDNTE